MRGIWKSRRYDVADSTIPVTVGSDPVNLDSIKF